MPTRITDTSATIIDHVYYYNGRGKHPGAADDLKMISGNLLSDLSDHLPNFTILMKNKTPRVNERPKVRTFSAHNKLNFNYALKNSDWSCVYSETDVNTAYDNFINIVTAAYEQSFPLVRLFRKRSRDRAWITSALKKSSKTKNYLYKKWITTRNKEDEIRYKKYRAAYRKVAQEAESLYYQQLFDSRY